MTNPNKIKEVLERQMEEFDEKFVKDNGDNVEPSIIDPDGCVGPIKSHIQNSNQELIEAVLEEIDELIEEDERLDNGDVANSTSLYLEQLRDTLKEALDQPTCPKSDEKSELKIWIKNEET